MTSALWIFIYSCNCKMINNVWDGDRCESLLTPRTFRNLKTAALTSIAESPLTVGVSLPDCLFMSLSSPFFRLSLPWSNWWRSAGTRTPQPGWQRCALRRPWTRFTALWRRARSRERERSFRGSCLMSGIGLEKRHVFSDNGRCKGLGRDGQRTGGKELFKCHPASSFSCSFTFSSFLCGCLPRDTPPSPWLKAHADVRTCPVWKSQPLLQDTHLLPLCSHWPALWTVTECEEHGWHIVVPQCFNAHLILVWVQLFLTHTHYIKHYILLLQSLKIQFLTPSHWFWHTVMEFCSETIRSISHN